MTTSRRFCRFNPDPAYSIAIRELPADGFCLSAFLLLTSPEHPGAVLLGHADPSANWEEVGALDPGQVAHIQDRWMLPSSQLLLGESPVQAAARIASEQLDLGSLPLEGPTVYSEVYGSARRPELTQHWDLHFVFRGRWPEGRPVRARAWRELAWVDAEATPGAQFARGHQDVLSLAGLRGPGGPGGRAQA